MQVVQSRYEGKVAVVTGGASGIGEAIVRRVVAEGGKVVIGDIDEARMAQLEGGLGDAVKGVRVDVRQEADVEAMVAAALDTFGGLHAGFNVAGLGGGADIVDMPLDQWQFVLDVCLDGVMLGMKHEGRAFIEQGTGGAILNIASLNSKVPMHGGAAYCAAKSAVAMLSRARPTTWPRRRRTSTATTRATSRASTWSSTVPGTRRATRTCASSASASPRSSPTRRRSLGPARREWVARRNCVIL